MIRRWLLAGALLIGAGVIALWLYRVYNATPYVQIQRLDAARARWEARPFRSNYRLYYEVRSDPPGDVREGKELRSTDSFFRWIENYPRSIKFRCGGLNFECTRPVSYRVRAVYDSQWGYPRTIVLTRTRHPDWTNPHFWRWLFTAGGWHQCENIICTTTERTTISIEMEH